MIACFIPLDEAYAENGNAQICRLTNKDSITDAAISYYLRAGEAYRIDAERGRCAGTGGKPCVNPFPYITIDQFKSENPNCCRILEDIPGDQPLSYRSNIKGNAYPKMYLVEIIFKARKMSKSNIENSTPEYLQRDILTIDCFGNVMRGDVQ